MILNAAARALAKLKMTSMLVFGQYHSVTSAPEGYMRAIFLLSIFLFASPLLARNEIITQIYDIDWGNIGEEPLIFLTTGQVVTYPQLTQSKQHTLIKAVAEKKWFKVILSESREIISIINTISPNLENNRNNIHKMLRIEEEFRPSILKDIDQANLYFKEARKDAKLISQCFNRAHIWSYEWRTKNNFYSSKAWLFFTRKFIRKYKFEWWFHVAPMLHVVVDGEVKERVMDIKYAKGPIKLKQWTNIFMRDSADCPVVENYTDHANYPESGSCFLMKSSMYYYQPIDLELKEMESLDKNKWLPSEVRHAYLEAFDVVL